MYIFPQSEENNNCVFSAIGLANIDNGKVYTCLTGSFPVSSNRGIQYMLILYVYYTNEFLVELIKKEVIQTFCAHAMSSSSAS